MKPLMPIVVCNDCRVECEGTESGLLCPKCGAYMSDELLNKLSEDESDKRASQNKD